MALIPADRWNYQAPSLIPHALGQDFWDSWNYPPTLPGQHFGTVAPLDFHDFRRLGRQMQGAMNREMGQLAKEGISNVVNDDQHFAVKMDVSHFKPEELEVKQVENTLLVTGTHEEKKDPHGYVKRSFTRKYLLPKDVKLEAMKTSLSKDGFLIIDAPKQSAIEPVGRPIPIEHVK